MPEICSAALLEGVSPKVDPLLCQVAFAFAVSSDSKLRGYSITQNFAYSVFRWFDGRVREFCLKESGRYMSDLRLRLARIFSLHDLKEVTDALLKRLALFFPYFLQLEAKIKVHQLLLRFAVEVSMSQSESEGLSELELLQVHSVVFVHILETVQNAFRQLHHSFHDSNIAIRTRRMIKCAMPVLFQFFGVNIRAQRSNFVCLETDRHRRKLVVFMNPDDNFGAALRKACAFWGFDFADIFSSVGTWIPVETRLKNVPVDVIMTKFVLHQKTPALKSFDFAISEVVRRFGGNFALDRGTRCFTFTRKGSSLAGIGFQDCGDSLVFPECFDSPRQYYYYFNGEQSKLFVLFCSLSDVVSWIGTWSSAYVPTSTCALGQVQVQLYCADRAKVLNVDMSPVLFELEDARNTVATLKASKPEMLCVWFLNCALSSFSQVKDWSFPTVMFDETTSSVDGDQSDSGDSSEAPWEPDAMGRFIFMEDSSTELEAFSGTQAEAKADFASGEQVTVCSDSPNFSPLPFCVSAFVSLPFFETHDELINRQVVNSSIDSETLLIMAQTLPETMSKVITSVSASLAVASIGSCVFGFAEFGLCVLAGASCSLSYFLLRANDAIDLASENDYVLCLTSEKMRLIHHEEVHSHPHGAFVSACAKAALCFEPHLCSYLRQETSFMELAKAVFSDLRDGVLIWSMCSSFLVTSRVLHVGSWAGFRLDDPILLIISMVCAGHLAFRMSLVNHGCLSLPQMQADFASTVPFVTCELLANSISPKTEILSNFGRLLAIFYSSETLSAVCYEMRRSQNLSESMKILKDHARRLLGVGKNFPEKRLRRRFLAITRLAHKTDKASQEVKDICHVLKLACEVLSPGLPRKTPRLPSLLSTDSPPLMPESGDLEGRR
eukprot:TRINITY_DN60820_c0_g1_i1.p1 TRINITY_DN60820_c0_g1~~TRINITY_DN60820_c0_g1_i1.p1  ORF type:complete len:995 (+),score=122.52 TRINITY_DN60820_c0_g1_i1:309-2987(+)